MTPGARPLRRSSWLHDRSGWPDIVAAIAVHDWTYAEPAVIALPDGRVLPLGRYARELRRFEFEIDEDLYVAVSEAGFAWEQPRRTAPAVDARPAVAATDVEAVLRSGAMRFREVQALPPSDNGALPIDVWITAGIECARHNGLTLVEALTDPERVVRDAHGDDVALGAWARELAAAECLGYITARHPALRAKHREFLRSPHQTHLRNVGLALQYAERYHSGDIPSEYTATTADGTLVRLGRWVSDQRDAAVRGALTPQRRALYEAIGLRLITRRPQDRWALFLEQVDGYAEAHGTTAVPNKFYATLEHGERFGVGPMLTALRGRYAAGLLTPEELADLDAHGIDVRSSATVAQRFDRGIRALDQFVAEHGHARPAISASVAFPDGQTFPIGRWIDSQRVRSRDGRMSESETQALTERGVDFNPARTQYQRSLHLFAQYVARTGSGTIATDHVEFDTDGKPYALGEWVNSQRKLIRTGRADQERIDELLALGFVINEHQATWDRHVAALRRFVAREGHGDVPVDHVEALDDGEPVRLGRWCTDQRSKVGTERRTPERTRELEDAGFISDPLDHRFQVGLAVLDRFIARTGHARVPSGHTEPDARGVPFKLGNFIEVRRRSARKDTLRPEHRAALEARGATMPEPTQREASGR